MSVALDEELKVMTKLLILFDCFPLCLHFAASLIKFIPWLNFFLIDGRQVDDMEWGSVLGRPNKVLLGYTLTSNSMDICVVSNLVLLPSISISLFLCMPFK